ncbi:MAG: holo-[acyl-carrier-protein] synthase [Candidatus Neomarinimicrobiota bacterium]|nr:MAG: holo-[acyl-carrier-protein] synthase [Candidatus Neomarinimicrobiota bacterium]
MIQTGIDIIEISRVAKSIENLSFVNKYFHPIEIEYSSKAKNATQHFAVRFAAKEAVRKILLSYIDDLEWKDSWIVNDENGKPNLYFSKKIKDILDIKHRSVSLSHSKDQAIAIVLMEVERKE